MGGNPSERYGARHVRLIMVELIDDALLLAALSVELRTKVEGSAGKCVSRRPEAGSQRRPGLACEG